MHPARILPWALALALGAAAPPAVGHDGDDARDGRKGEAALLPPDGGPQPEARGEIEVFSSAERQRLEIEVEHADASVGLEVFVLAEGAATSLGTLPAGDGTLEFDSNVGTPLPLGAATVDALAGLAVEVRDATSAVVLAGTIPAPAAEDDEDDDGDHDGDDDGDDDDGDHDGGPPARGRLTLMLAATSPFPDAEGKVEAEAEGDGWSVEIEAEGLPAGTGVEFFLADSGGAMTSIGTATADEEGEAEIEIASAEDPAGRRVEVRASADGAVLLFGEVPAATVHAQKLRCRGDVQAAESRARVRVTALVDNRSGRERLNVELKAIARGAAEAELFLDDGAGTLTLVGAIPLKRSGRGWARYDTKRGTPLPLGASSVQDLQGRAFEIRVEGAAVVSGSFPNF